MKKNVSSSITNPYRKIPFSGMMLCPPVLHSDMAILKPISTWSTSKLYCAEGTRCIEKEHVLIVVNVM